jgi:hypothetical protein
VGFELVQGPLIEVNRWRSTAAACVMIVARLGVPLVREAILQLLNGLYSRGASQSEFRNSLRTYLGFAIPPSPPHGVGFQCFAGDF